VPTFANLNNYIVQLIKSERYNEEEGYWHFANGIGCATCTNGARLVAKRFGGIVWGYYSVDNPSAALGHSICAGHDFAIVSNRWLVDYWAYRYPEKIPRSVLDAQQPEDQAIINTMYGSPECWKRMASFDGPGLIPEDNCPVIGQKGFIGFRYFVGQSNSLTGERQKVLL